MYRLSSFDMHFDAHWEMNKGTSLGHHTTVHAKGGGVYRRIGAINLKVQLLSKLIILDRKLAAGIPNGGATPHASVVKLRQAFNTIVYWTWKAKRRRIDMADHYRVSPKNARVLDLDQFSILRELWWSIARDPDLRSWSPWFGYQDNSPRTSPP